MYVAYKIRLTVYSREYKIYSSRFNACLSEVAHQISISFFVKPRPTQIWMFKEGKHRQKPILVSKVQNGYESKVH